MGRTVRMASPKARSNGNERILHTNDENCDSRLDGAV